MCHNTRPNWSTCPRCRITKAAKHGKNARIRANIPHPSDLLNSITLLDTACTADFLTFYSTVHGYRYWIIFTLHHSLYCVAEYVPSYSAYHTLLTMLKVAAQYNVNTFHWDAAAQALPLVTDISRMQQCEIRQVLSKDPQGVLGRLLTPRKTGRLNLPQIHIETHLPRRHFTAGFSEKRISLCKQFLRALQIDPDIDTYELNFTLQCGVAQINALHTFSCGSTYIAPIHLRSYTAVPSPMPPSHLSPKQSTAIDVINSAREACTMAMLDHKIHLLASPATESAISCGVSATQVMCGTVCMDLNFIKEHKTVHNGASP